MSEFDSRSEALNVVAERLGTVSEFSPQVLKVFSRKANIVEELPAKPIGKVQPALVGRFAIRNDLLFSVESFFALAKSAAKLAVGIAGITTLPGAATIADALFDIYKLYIHVTEKGFKLSDSQFAVITSLQKLNIATTHELAACLSTDFSEEQIETILITFTHESNGGKGFISKDDNGRWRIEGL